MDSRYMNTRIKILDILVPILLVTIVFFLSCKDDGTGPIIGDTNFSFKIIVKDTAGNPVNGLRVSAWGILSIENELGFNKTRVPSQFNKTDNILAQSTLHFSLAANAYVLLSVFNLRNQETDNLVEQVLYAGQYSVSWALPFGSPTGVYKIRLNASNDSIHFQDSIYAVYHNHDPEQNVVGWTTNDGVLEVADTLIFPKILDLPQFIYTNQAGPDSLGTFYYTDSVAVVLSDTEAQKQQKYYVTVGKQKNTYNLIWNPPNNVSASIKQDFYSVTRRQSILADTVIIILPPLKWKLMQNYPNPFN